MTPTPNNTKIVQNGVAPGGLCQNLKIWAKVDESSGGPSTLPNGFWEETQKNWVEKREFHAFDHGKIQYIIHE